MIGCTCAVCQSTDPRDRRLRPSIHVEVPDRASILVDTTPDLRQQALLHRITRLDAVLFTHSHADHILGLDDIRSFNFIQQEPVPCYATPEVWENIRQMFRYVFDAAPRQGGGIPKVVAHDIAGPFTVAGVHRDRKHSTHFTVAEALEAIERIAPRRAYLTHMAHDLGHAGTSARMPAGVEPAYDGLVLDATVNAS